MALIEVREVSKVYRRDAMEIPVLANVSISVVATYVYVNPIVAVALGALILMEPITPRTLIAAAIIIGAVVAMVTGRPRAVDAPEPLTDKRLISERD